MSKKLPTPSVPSLVNDALPLLTAAEMKTADARTQRDMGLSELILMEHAAMAVANALEQRFGRYFKKTRGLIVAGVGNNGGDALCVARLVAEKGVLEVSAVICGDENSLSTSAKVQRDILKKMGFTVDNLLRADALKNCDWIVDGLFGTGLSRPISGGYLNIIEQINRASSDKWVVSVDIPSGLSSDTGKVLGVCIRASETVALGFAKRGLVTGDAADYVGRVRLAPIQMPRALAKDVDSFWYRPRASHLPERPLTAHKGDFGHVYIWAGKEETQGAGILCAEGALRSGAGLTTLVGSESAIVSLRPRLMPEVMSSPATSSIFDEKQGVFALGPGMGVSEQSWEIVSHALKSQRKLLLDADALNVISEHLDEAKSLLKKRDKFATVMTPHPKEASRLLECDVEEIERDRFESARKLTEAFHSTIVLKGKGTLLTAPKEPTFVITEGDPSLSKGGSGDLLTGILASYLAQGLEGLQLALGISLHGRAAEITTQRFGNTAVATTTELADALKTALTELT